MSDRVRHSWYMAVVDRIETCAGGMRCTKVEVCHVVDEV